MAVMAWMLRLGSASSRISREVPGNYGLRGASCATSRSVLLSDPEEPVIQPSAVRLRFGLECDQHGYGWPEATQFRQPLARSMARARGARASTT